MPRPPMVQDTGIPTQHFQTEGLMVALQMRAPLEGVVFTTDISGLLYSHSELS